MELEGIVVESVSELETPPKVLDAEAESVVFWEVSIRSLPTPAVGTGLQGAPWTDIATTTNVRRVRSELHASIPLY